MVLKNKFISLMVIIVAAAFIVFVVVDNFAKEEVEDTITYDTSDEQNNEKSEVDKNTSAKPKDEVGILGGMLAPDFTLPLWGTDQEASLSDYRGEIVVLNLWASWCPPCRREMPDLIKFHENNQDTGVQVLSVNLTTLERSENGASEFMEEYKVSFPTFVDQPIDQMNQRGIVASLYKVQTIPATYVLDEEGRIFMAIRGEVNLEMLEDIVSRAKDK